MTIKYSVQTPEKWRKIKLFQPFCGMIKVLYAKRDEMKKKELHKVVETSSRSYEEIMVFLAGKDDQGK